MSEQETSLQDFVGREDPNDENHIIGFGSFPGDWSKQPLEECAKIRDSERIPLNRSEREAKKPGDIPYYGANGVVDYINEYIFDSELVLLAEDGGHFDEYQQRPVAYRISGKAWVNNHAHILEARDGIATDYLFYSLEHRNLVPYVAGSTRSKLTQTMLKRVSLPVPPLEEQHKIASVLFAIDEAIQKTEEIIEQIKTIRQGLRQDFFTFGVNESGELRSFDQTKETYLGPVPENWNLLRIDDICSHVVDCPHSTPDYAEEGIIVVRTSEIENGKFDPTDAPRVTEEGYRERISRLEPIPGDVIFTREAPIGEAFKIPEGMKLCLGQRIVQLRPKDDTLNPDFLVELLYSDMMQSWFERSARGTTSKHINVEDIENMKIPIPPLDEQQRIDSVLGTYRNNIETEQEYLSTLKFLKQGLMQDLLSGTVRTTDTNIEVLPEIEQHG